jgi:hypothetical protein
VQFGLDQLGVGHSHSAARGAERQSCGRRAFKVFRNVLDDPVTSRCAASYSLDKYDAIVGASKAMFARLAIGRAVVPRFGLVI